ncbi:aldo/keto reductase [Clostridium grantii]|uniref:Aldo/keto reductase n=1 Tax=Clostridium grantii DSM 8605 TaxID=1121316 RepID=A0A1M5VEJ8_9CLOT|nr:aldo/keto reductase [Clostridium grantii]SHH73353.1 Aldo/keto reductase [Clostridium grantii DSM 8605]
MKSVKDIYTLNNQTKIPCVGYGTWQMPNDDTGYQALLTAFEAGYSHIDTAEGYDNEETVGKAIKNSGIPREEIFLTTKLGNKSHGYEETLLAFEASLERLQVSYVDLYLIHWPNPVYYRDHWEETIQSTWRAMEKLYMEGKIKAIGVSNFKIHHLEALLKTAKIIPAVNQLRLCPGDVDSKLVQWCEDKGILLQAYSPLGTGKVLQLEVVNNIAKKHNTSAAYIALAWSIQRGFQPLVKSVKPHRIIDNTKFFHVTLDEEDMNLLNQLNGCVGHADDPDTVPW